MPLPHALGRFNKHATNRVIEPLAGYAPGLAVVVHHGRRSGKEYSTPVMSFGSPDRFRFALTYGKDTDWGRNVLAEGGCTVQNRGRSVNVDDPWIGRDPTANWAPPVVRHILRALGVEYYLQCRKRAE